MATLLKRLLPVIHCVCPYDEQGVGHALANARVAFENGADGIFLIGHSLPYEDLLYIYEQIRKQYLAGQQDSRRWIGVNLLDVSASKNWKLFETIAKKYPDLDAIWMDGMPDTRLSISIRIELFGGVAFKYIASGLSGDELVEACKNASSFVNTITTSGDKTGSPPNVAKLEKIREIIGPNRPLALASGVSFENVGLFLPTVDTFLVSSSISERREDRGNHEYLIPEKVMALATDIHRWPWRT